MSDADTLSRFDRLRRNVAIAITVVALGCAVSIYISWNEGRTRADQFCALTVARHNDNVQRYISGIKFLNSPTGRENTGLNRAIVKSLPETKKQIIIGVKNMPSYCADNFQVKSIPPSAKLNPRP